MTFPLAGLGAPTAAPAAQGQNRTQLGRDQFLSLLVTQLRYQDPLSPLEADAFAAQLAQFSTVEQLTQLNKSFETQLGEQMRSALLTKTSLGASLIGRHVLAEGNEIQVASNGSVSLPVEIASGGGTATARFVDAAGRVVATKTIGQVGAGVQTLDVSPGLPAGNYRYFVDVQGADGQTIGVTTYMDGVVDGVLFENGVIMLRMGNRKVALDLLSEITS